MSLESIEKFIKPVKHHLLTLSFVGGFILDNFTLNRIDQWFDNTLLAGYVVLAALAIIYLYWGTSGKLSDRVALHAATWAPLAMQFSFGNLMSGLLVFYSRSGSWWTSWPFLLILLIVILGNEFVKRRNERLVFNLSVFFVGLFSYSVLLVPVVLGTMGALVFVGSGLVALVFFWAIAQILYAVVPNFMALNTRMILFSIGLIYVGLNTLYFTNLIPPIPLSMKEIGIYHNVSERTEEGYVLTYEQGPWYALWHRSDTTYHYTPGDRVYCFTSIFAPTRLSTDVVHHWERYDKEVGWKEHVAIPFPIKGGRASGYRGYSYIESVQDGTWRCKAETARGQIIGMTTFTVETGAVPQPLVTRVEL